MSGCADDAPTTLDCAGRLLQFDRPRIMGVLNITPDSFSDGGRLFSAGQPELSLIRSRALSLLEQGADILDVGGESTRPGAEPVPRSAEMARVLPVIDALKELDVIVSVDTRHAEVAAAAIEAGAHMVNDVGAGSDPGMFEVLAASRAAYCLMHMQGNPATMQRAPRYDSVVEEVRSFLQTRYRAALAAGMQSDRLVVDPGFGFGKTLEHNLALLAGLEGLRIERCALLVGLSRKSMLGKITGQPVERRVSASVTAAVLAAQRGANILRVHDVAETRDGLNVWLALRAAACN